MNLKEIKELVLFLKEEDITEFELERGDVKIRIRRGATDSAPPPADRIIAVHPAPVAQMHVPTAAAIAAPVAAQPASEAARAEEGLHIVRSPIVGTYYESPSPGAPPFVKPGDSVEAGQLLCIVE